VIGKIITGSSFRGLVNYLLDPSKTPEIISTNLAGTDRNTMIWELNACGSQRPTTKKPVKHISIGFAPDDNSLDPGTIDEIAQAVIDISENYIKLVLLEFPADALPSVKTSDLTIK
jgi:hypothetical protein